MCKGAFSIDIRIIHSMKLFVIGDQSLMQYNKNVLIELIHVLI